MPCSLPPLVQILILVVAWRRCGNEDLRPALLQRYVDLFGRTIDLLLMQVLQLRRRRGEEPIRRRRHCRRQCLRPELLLLQLMQLQLRLNLWLKCCRCQWLAIGDCCRLRLLLLMANLCDDLLLLLGLLLVLHTHLRHVLHLHLLGLVLLWLRLIGHRLAMLLRLWLMLYAWTGSWLHLLLLIVVVALVLVVVLGEVTFRVAQRHVRLALVLLQIDRFVEVVVDDVVLGGLLADVVVRGGHADQVDLVEREALRADP